MTPEINPSHILQIGTGFWASKTLLSAVELGLYTELAGGSLTCEEIRERLGLHPRAVADFLDSLVALGLLAREGDGPDARYANTRDTAVFLDRGKPSYVGGILEMCNARLYPFWGALTEGLRTGKPQNEIKDAGAQDLFQAIYSDAEKLEQFMNAMSGVQMGAFLALVETFDFSGYKTLCDVGGASGALSVAVARRHGHMRCISYDLPAVGPIARRRFDQTDFADRLEIAEGNFFKDEKLPAADVITMGNILHDWGRDDKVMLMRKAFEALPEGGAFIAIENVIDDARRQNAFGLLMSLNMLIETPEGFDYSGQQFAEWGREVGFARTEVRPLAGPTSAAIAYK